MFYPKTFLYERWTYIHEISARKASMKFSLVVGESLCVAPLIVEISTMEIYVDMTRKNLELQFILLIFTGILISRTDLNFHRWNVSLK